MSVDFDSLDLDFFRRVETMALSRASAIVSTSISL